MFPDAAVLSLHEAASRADELASKYIECEGKVLMRSWSISAGRLFGVEIRIHLTFLFLLAFIWLTEAAPRGTLHPGRGVALLLIIFGSVVVHEIGHSLASARAGISAKAVILLPIGGVTLLDETRLPLDSSDEALQRDVRIALAGPLVSLLMALVCGMAVLALYPQSHLWAAPWIDSTNLARSLVWVNFGLAGLNLLPAYPLDGGRILRAIFARRSDAVRATRRAVTIGIDNGGQVEITMGVQPGETVVATGQNGLPDGAKVTPAAAKAAEP